MAGPRAALDVAALTDIGLKRTRNEDFCEYRIPEPGSPHSRHGALFVVADGMGGMGGGDAASQAAVAALFSAYYGAELTPVTTPMALLKDALDRASAAVREKAQQINLPRIGSTAAGLVLLPEGEALAFNVGDARVYRVRQGVIEQITHDQSVLQHQIDAGVISEEQARVARNVNVTAFIGQPTPLEAVYRRVQVQRGDIYVICSDGLWDPVEEHEIAQIVQQYPAAQAVRRLIDLARKRGAPDNVTAIVLRAGPRPAMRRPWWTWAAALFALAVIAAVIAVLVLGGGAEEDRQTATAGGQPIAGVPATASATPRPSVTPRATAIPLSATETAIAGLIVIEPSNTPTPSHTPTLTSTPTDTPLPSYTPTPVATDTPIPTPTPSPTPSATATETPSPSPTPTRTLRPTATATPSPQPSATPRPSNTPQPPTPTPVTPTVTLIPALAELTRMPTSTPTPTLTAGELLLYISAEQDVVLVLSAPARIWRADPQAAPGSTPELLPEPEPLEEGTRVRVISAEERTITGEPGAALPATEEPDLLEHMLPWQATQPATPAAPTATPAKATLTALTATPAEATPSAADGAIVLREVEVLIGEVRARTGWVPQEALQDAVPETPYVTPVEAMGVNVRSGNSTAYNQVGSLKPGEIARLLAISTGTQRWYQIELSTGVRGFVRPDLVRVIGSVEGLPSVTPPPPPTAAPTSTPAPVVPTPIPGGDAGGQPGGGEVPAQPAATNTPKPAAPTQAPQPTEPPPQPTEPPPQPTEPPPQPTEPPPQPTEPSGPPTDPLEPTTEQSP